MTVKCNSCKTAEADYDVSNRATDGTVVPWKRVFLCIACLTPVLLAILHKMGLTIVDLHTLLAVPPVP